MNEKGYVHPDTLARVKQAIEQLNYAPGGSQTVGNALLQAKQRYYNSLAYVPEWYSPSPGFVVLELEPTFELTNDGEELWRAEALTPFHSAPTAAESSAASSSPAACSSKLPAVLVTASSSGASVSGASHPVKRPARRRASPSRWG